MTGHLLGGAGALEAIATVLAIHHRVSSAHDQPRRQRPPGRARHPDLGARPAVGRHRRPEQLLRLRRRQRGRRVRERVSHDCDHDEASAHRGPPLPGPPDHRTPRRGHDGGDHARGRLRDARRGRARERAPGRGVLLRRDRHGRRHGRPGLPRRGRCLPPGDDRRGADHRALALRRRPVGRGRAVSPRGGPDLPGDDPGVRARSRRSRWCSARRPAARRTARR